MIALPPADPYAVYDNARERWAVQRYPHWLDYTVVVTVVHGHSTKSERYATTFDAYTNSVQVHAVSDYERLHPATGSGVRFCFQGCPNGTDVPDPDQDFIGVPQLAPNYSFGMWQFAGESDVARDDMALVQQIRAELHDPAPHLERAPQPTTIATVVARNRSYDIALRGQEVVDSKAAYHLTLRPLRDAQTYRLRDLWVDASTYETIRADVADNFTSWSGSGVAWQIDFVSVGGAQYLSRETALGGLRYGARYYEKAIVSFEDLHARTKPPLPYIGFFANQVLYEP